MSDVALTPELRAAAESARREDLAQSECDVLWNLTWDLANLGKRLIEQAAYVQADRLDDRRLRFRLEDLRKSALGVGRVLAAYDAAVAEGRRRISNAEWKKLHDEVQP